MFAFFHFDSITEEIFSYAASQEHEKYGDNEQKSVLPLARSIIDLSLMTQENGIISSSKRGFEYYCLLA